MLGRYERCAGAGRTHRAGLRVCPSCYGGSHVTLIPSHRPALPDQERTTRAREFHAARQADQQRYDELRQHARAVLRAFKGRRPICSLEAWPAAGEDARQRDQAGRFLIERWGAERLLGPPGAWPRCGSYARPSWKRMGPSHRP